MVFVRPALLVLFAALLPAQPVDLMFALETTPGTEQATALIQPKDLGPDDRAGVVAFKRSASLIGPLTQNQDKLSAALEEAGVRIGVAVGVNSGAPLNRSFTVSVAEAIQEAAAEISKHGFPARQRAIVLFFAGEDPDLSAHMDALESLLASAEIRLYAVLVYRTGIAAPPGMPPLAGTRQPAPAPVSTPALTAHWVSKLAKRSGGKLYRSNWAMGKILASARKP
ncbi:MAG: hypothetical protein GC160_21370 [Acidobacteria bacterium]|nr:hypothetical protein [Acidobacteriota bacterium]